MREGDGRGEGVRERWRSKEMGGSGVREGDGR